MEVIRPQPTGLQGSVVGRKHTCYAVVMWVCHVSGFPWSCVVPACGTPCLWQPRRVACSPAFGPLRVRKICFFDVQIEVLFIHKHLSRLCIMIRSNFLKSDFVVHCLQPDKK